MLLPSPLGSMSNRYPFHDAVPFDLFQGWESPDLLQTVHGLPNYGMGMLCLPDTAVPAEGTINKCLQPGTNTITTGQACLASAGRMGGRKNLQ